MTTTTRVRSLLKETDLDRGQFLGLVDDARELRAAKRAGREEPRLTGLNIALIFQKNSTRTRSAFEVAAYDQGAHVTYLGPDGSHLGTEESVADTAKVLGSFMTASSSAVSTKALLRSSPHTRVSPCGTASQTSGIRLRCWPMY